MICVMTFARMHVKTQITASALSCPAGAAAIATSQTSVARLLAASKGRPSAKMRGLVVWGQAPRASATKSTFVSATKSTFVSATKGTFVSATKSTFVSATKSTFVSATKSTFVSATKSTFV